MKTCIDCEAELTGGLDTFGRDGEEQCYSCYFAPAPIAEETGEINAEIDRLYELRADLEGELDEIEAQILTLKIKRQDGKKKNIDSVNRKLAAWVGENGR